MGHADRHERRHRSDHKDDRNPPGTQARLVDTSKSVPVTSEKQDSIIEWIETTGTRRTIKASPTGIDHEDDLANTYALVSSRRPRSREKETWRSPTPTGRRSRFTRDLTRDMSNMTLSTGKRGKKAPRGTRGFPERAESPVIDEGDGKFKGDAMTDTPETRKLKERATERAIARNARKSSKQLESTPSLRIGNESPQCQYYADPTLEQPRSPSRLFSRSPSRERTSGKLRSTKRTDKSTRRYPDSRSPVLGEVRQRHTDGHTGRAAEQSRRGGRGFSGYSESVPPPPTFPSTDGEWRTCESIVKR